MIWSIVSTHVLEGTTLELHPEYGSGLWFVIDRRRPNRSIAGPLPLRSAKAAAERRAAAKQRRAAVG